MVRRLLLVSLAALALPVFLPAQQREVAPTVLPAAAVKTLEASLAAAAAHATHLWRDSAPTNDDGSVNAFVEIPRGDRRKWEFDMGAGRRAIDRVMPATVGGYPVNYGFVPQTVSYDGDPFDALVLGPPLEGGVMVRGVIVGLMMMEDEKGLDSKVVLSRIDRQGRPLHALTAAVRDRIGDYFDRYKRHEAGKFSVVPGWASAADGRAFVDTTHAFFLKCRSRVGEPCDIERERRDSR